MHLVSYVSIAPFRLIDSVGRAAKLTDIAFAWKLFSL